MSREQVPSDSRRQRRLRTHRRSADACRPTLAHQPVGASLRMTGLEPIAPDRDREVRMELLGLGLRIGQTIAITHTRGAGVVVAVEAGRVAVGPELARLIHVSPAPAHPSANGHSR